MKKCILLLITSLIIVSQSLNAQDYFVTTGLGYGIANGPIEKYRGTSINLAAGKYFGNFFISAGYNHFTGDVNYKTLYSRDTPNVGVVDKYRDNYPLREYSTGELKEREAGLYQFDPSFSFYIARQARLNLGFKAFSFKFLTASFSIQPSIGLTYSHIGENFIYGVKKIIIEDGFQSENFIEVNHLIFAYLKYSDFGYNLNVPLRYQSKKNIQFSLDLNLHQTSKGLLSSQVSLGILKMFSL